MGFGGLDNSLKYTEFEFDSIVAQQSLDSAYAKTDWPLFILGKPLSNVAAVKILECQIPFSYYVFNASANYSNNTFQLTETIAATPYTSTVTIPEGNYTYATLPAVLIAALGAASHGGFTYTVTYNTSLQSLTFSNNDATTGDTFAFTFGTTNDLGQTNPRSALGFNAGISTSSPVTSSTAYTAILSPGNVVQLTGPNYIYICSRFLGSMVRLYLPATASGTYGMGADGPQVAKVPMTVNPGGVSQWQDPDAHMWFDLENLTNFAQIDFYCVLGSGPEQIPITFNGNSFSIKLGILTNESSHNDYLGGGKQNDRVTSRTWPTGAGMQF